MRQKAVGAILYAALYVLEISAALIPERVQGAKAEHTVEILRLCLVTGEIYTFFVFVIAKAVFH